VPVIPFPDLKDSLGTAVNGMLRQRSARPRQSEGAAAEVQAAAEEFNKRYEKVQNRVPAGHAWPRLPALWTLFKDVLPRQSRWIRRMFVPRLSHGSPRR